VDDHIDRQFKAHKEKEIVKNLQMTGAHRSVKKKSKKTRVTIPVKRRYNRKFIREVMGVIQNRNVPSSETNLAMTAQELALKGFDQDDLAEIANDIENEKIKKIKDQFETNDSPQFPESTAYSTAVDTLKGYLRSFEL
jgi:hypothetical protein